MNTSITSNWRPLLRAVSAFLIALVANAQAQVPTTLFVSQVGFSMTSPPTAGTVNAYNINSTPTSLLGGFTPIAGLNSPAGLAVGGNVLYVADRGAGTVTAYDAGTGAQLPSTKFKTISVKKPSGLAVNGNSILYVASSELGTVNAYDAKGNQLAVSDFNPITGLNKPSGLAVSGTTLYVASLGMIAGDGMVTAYDSEGDVLNNGNALISGLMFPSGLALGGPVLYVAEGSGTVVAYTITTVTVNKEQELVATPLGGFTPPTVNGPTGLAVTGSGNSMASLLFVVATLSGTVTEYHASTGGMPINSSAPFLSNLIGPVGIAVK